MNTHRIELSIRLPSAEPQTDDKYSLGITVLEFHQRHSSKNRDERKVHTENAEMVARGNLTAAYPSLGVWKVFQTLH